MWQLNAYIENDSAAFGIFFKEDIVQQCLVIIIIIIIIYPFSKWRIGP